MKNSDRSRVILLLGNIIIITIIIMFYGHLVMLGAGEKKKP